MTYSIDAQKRLVLATVTGPLLDADLDDYISSLIQDRAYRPGMSILVLCTKVEVGSFSASNVRRIAHATRELEHLMKGTRVAIVADQSVVYGLARMYQILRNAPYALQVFREPEAARRWLDEEHETTPSA